jgi:hypothetical protein
MLRLLPRRLFALGPPVCAGLLLAVLLWSGSLIPGARAASAPISSPPERYCYNWDFLNNTGQDADDLHIRLQGISQVSAVYTGTVNPFGLPDATSGYDAGLGVYNLNFSNGVAYDGDVVHIGLCTDKPALALSQSTTPPPFTWTSQGQPLQPAPLFVGVSWDWQSRTHLRLELHNSQDITLTLWAASLLDPEVPLGLEDLNADVIGMLPAATFLIDDVQMLPPRSSSFFDVFFDPTVVVQAPTPAQLREPRHPYVLQAVVSAEDDSGDVAHMYSQALSPPAKVYWPLILKKK